jgi:hypothetical protein
MNSKVFSAIKNMSIIRSTLKLKFIPPPIDIACRADEDTEVKQLFKSNLLSHVLFAGCRDSRCLY